MFLWCYCRLLVILSFCVLPSAIESLSLLWFNFVQKIDHLFYLRAHQVFAHQGVLLMLDFSFISRADVLLAFDSTATRWWSAQKIPSTFRLNCAMLDPWRWWSKQWARLPCPLYSMLYALLLVLHYASGWLFSRDFCIIVDYAERREPVSVENFWSYRCYRWLCDDFMGEWQAIFLLKCCWFWRKFWRHSLRRYLWLLVLIGIIHYDF